MRTAGRAAAGASASRPTQNRLATAGNLPHDHCGAMYRITVPKSDLAARWALPDRVFFACGACHILAYAMIDRYSHQSIKAVWIKPHAGYTGNHIVAVNGEKAFDYHGYS